MPDEVRRAPWPAAAVPPPVVEMARWVVRAMREADGGKARWVAQVDAWVKAMDGALAGADRAVTAASVGADAVPAYDEVTPTSGANNLPPSVVSAARTATVSVSTAVTAAPVVCVAPVDLAPSTTANTDPVVADNDSDDDDATPLALHLTTALPASGKVSPVWPPTAATGLAAGPGRRPRSASAVAGSRARPASGPRVMRGRAGSSA
ncbi:hypothetical protein AMAG_08430, partial [Allomyces macrogynus ATCC 38327]